MSPRFVPRARHAPEMHRSPCTLSPGLLLSTVALLTTGCAPPDVCGAGGERPPTATTPSVHNGFMARAHAHNDYEHDRPLEDALAAGFASVEADVWHRGGDVVVSHDAVFDGGTLQALYLDPLAERLADGGSVHGDGATFTLWLDLKDGTPELRALLVAQLTALPFLRRFDDDDDVADSVTGGGAVTVIITGDAASKAALLDEVATPRPFIVDSNDLPAPIDDLAAGVGAFALSFSTWLGAWDGSGDAPASLRTRGACIVARAHGDERRRPVRFFGGPDTEAAWDLVLDIGADFVNTDDLAGLETFLDQRR